MTFALDLIETSLFLAVIAIILLITSEIISPYYGKTGILIEKQRLRKISLITVFIFIITIIIQVYYLLIQ
jgi:hypothetical protein